MQRKIKKEQIKILQTPAVWSLETFPQAEVSLFENMMCVQPCKTVNLFEFLLTSDYQSIVEIYRMTVDIDKKTSIKKYELPCVTVAGVFDTRSAKRLVHRHSGYICIDIDGKQNRRVGNRWELVKDMLGTLFNSLCYAGLSVGGNGLCLIFKIAYPHCHKGHFYALVDEIKARTGLIVDESGSDVVRLRVASFDDSPYFNPDAVAYVHIKKHKHMALRAYPKYRTAEQSNAINQKVEVLINQIRDSKTDITKGRKVWIAIGQALANEYGEEEGLRLFQCVSMYHPDYYPPECDEMFHWCASHCSRTRIQTFFYHCKRYGLTFK